MSLRTPVEDQLNQMTKMLENFLKILEKAEVFAESKKIDSLVLVESRLAIDQFPLKKQIQLASDTAKFLAARLTGKTAPVFEDNEVTMDDLKVRLYKTIDYLKTVKPELLKEWEARKITVSWMEGQHIPGKNYFLEMAIPNFYFHLTTAYSILRHLGLEIGKSDFLGELPFKKD